MEPICSSLHSLVRSLPRHTFPPSGQVRDGDGIYLVFEVGEVGHGGERVVRVGSHTGAGNLFARLREHVTANKDRSIFRKNIGRAILSRAGDPFLDDWDLDLTSNANRLKFAGRVDSAKQTAVEAQVTNYVKEKMTFTVIPMPDPKTALSLERLIIGTLSACGECKASPDWLGSRSPKAKIRESGLWQEQHLYTEGLSTDDLLFLTSQGSSAGGPTTRSPGHSPKPLHVPTPPAASAVEKGAGISNDVQLGALLDQVRSALILEVEKCLQNGLGGHWQEEITSRYQIRKQSGAVPWDTYALLRCVLDYWPKAFKNRLPAVARNYVGELLDARNVRAHDGVITDAVLKRAQDTARLLLNAVGCQALPSVKGS